MSVERGAGNGWSVTATTLRPGPRRRRAATVTAMSTHIAAAPGEIAPHVLMPGDPLRGRWIAEPFIEDARCSSEVRGMLGFTGRYRGEPMSVQGSGMGLP